MTPEERDLLTQFLSDLTKTQGVAKDGEAAQLIDQAFRSNPDAAYVLTQHALISDQALHQAQAQIEQLQAQLRAQPQPQSSFLGGGQAAQPTYPQGQGYQGSGYPQGSGYQPAPPPSPWAQAAQPQDPYAQQGGGFFGGGPLGGQRSGLGSFLQSAGTTAAGVAGGAFLFEGLSNIFGGHHGMGGFGGGGFGGGGFGGGMGGFGGGQSVENVTINNYGDDSDDDYDDKDPGTSGDIGGDDYS